MNKDQALPSMLRSVHTILYSKEWARCVSFYRDVLLFPVAYSNRVFVEFEPVSGARIGLIDATRSSRRSVSCDSTLLSFCVRDLEKVHALLSRRCPGVSEIRAHPWGARLFELKDPEGRRLEFWSPAP